MDIYELPLEMLNLVTKFESRIHVVFFDNLEPSGWESCRGQLLEGVKNCSGQF